jgi:hypothetical protein
VQEETRVLFVASKSSKASLLIQRESLAAINCSNTLKSNVGGCKMSKRERDEMEIQ